MADQSDTLMSLLDRPHRHTNLTKCIEEGFGDPKYADFEIHCADRVWRVHRLVICGQCPFFDKACSGDFMGSNSKIIHLEEDNPNVVNEMLRFLYTGDFLDHPGEFWFGEAVNPLVVDVLVHTIADKYDIPALAHLAVRKFNIRIAEEWNTPSFAEAIGEIYTGPDHGKEDMRGSAVATAAKHAKELFNPKSPAEFQDMAKSVPQFAAELCAALSQDRKSLAFSTHQCLSCQKTVSFVMAEVLSYGLTSKVTCNYCYDAHSYAQWQRNKNPRDA